MTLKRSRMKSGTSTLKRTAFVRSERKEGAAVAKLSRLRTTKSKPQATAAERAHLAAVAEIGCILCQHLDFGPTPAEVHHVRARHGWGRSGHFATIPLCPAHHRGQPFGIHDMGRAEFTARYGVSELELLEAVTLRLKNGKEPIDCESPSSSITNNKTENP